MPETVTRTTWVGRAGLARLAPVGRFAAAEPAEFEAEWLGAENDGVQIAEWRCTPVTGALYPEPAMALRIDLVAAGAARYRIENRELVAGPGSALLFRTDRQFLFVSRGDFRVLQVRLQPDQLPAWLRQESVSDGRALPGSALLAGFSALVDRIVAAIRAQQTVPSRTTMQAIAVLATAMLDEAVPLAADDADLRQRMDAYIARHLADQDLGPVALAAEFAVSVRWAHRLYQDSGSTIARSIRERRLDAVTDDLHQHGCVSVSDLAARFGFAGRDQLARAFRARYGSTIHGYLAARAGARI